jgi:inorganic pyrophosphatase
VIHPWKDLSPGRDPPHVVTAVVEIPGGSRNKYELDKASGLFRLDRVLYSAVHYPGDYGFLPQTLHTDGDPLDVLVYIDEPTFTGCLIDVRPVGVLNMLDRGEHDDKILAVAIGDPLVSEYLDVSDLPSHYLTEVAHFFSIYKDLEGKRVEIVGWEGMAAAKAMVLESIQRYSDQASFSINRS